MRRFGALISLIALFVGGSVLFSLARGQGPHRYDPYPFPPELEGVNLLGQSEEAARAKSAGCVRCHEGAHDPHSKDTTHLGCCDCHGGDPGAADKARAHVASRFPDAWPT